MGLLGWREEGIGVVFSLFWVGCHYIGLYVWGGYVCVYWVCMWWVKQ